MSAPQLVSCHDYYEAYPRTTQESIEASLTKSLAEHFEKLDKENFSFHIYSTFDRKLQACVKQLNSIETIQNVYAVLFNILFLNKSRKYEQRQYCLISENTVVEEQFLQKFQLEEKFIKTVKNTCHVALGKGLYYRFQFTTKPSGMNHPAFVLHLETANNNNPQIELSENHLKILKAIPFDQNTIFTRERTAFAVCSFYPKDIRILRELNWLDTLTVDQQVI